MGYMPVNETLPKIEIHDTKIPVVLDENTIDAVIEEYAHVLGLNPSDILPASSHCKPILTNGVSCNDFIGVRQFVLCYAWGLLKKRSVTSFKDAVDQAWAYVRQYCHNV